ncbi:MAG: acyltransferase family protein [Verrucomicrobiaceae bacterium]
MNPDDFAHLRNRFQYRPDIDGLRALAVIPVLFFHAGLGFPGGYVGVDIFFVISGYLITSLIIREMIKGEFTLRNFWERRVRRIFPPAVFVTIVTVIAGAWILLPEAYAAIGKAAIAQVTMVANFYFWQQDGYFAGPSDLEPLLHMWSLAVEEQFYFLFPFLLIALVKRGERTTRLVLWTIFIVSLVWSFYGVEHFKKATFYLLPARAWELLIGSLLAILPLPKLGSVTSRTAAAFIGLALIIYSIATYSLATPFPGLAAIPPCLGAALLIYAHETGPTAIGRLLSLSPIVFIGKISFSLYLWHWPLLVYGRHLSIHEMSLEVRWGIVIASFILAILSWLFIETPFRKKRWGAQQPQLFRFFGWSTLVLALLFTGLYKADGIPARFQGDNARFAEASMEISLAKDIDEAFTDFPILLPASDQKPLPFLVWGDSHARGMISMFQEIAESEGINGYYACRSSTPPLLDVNCLPDDDSLAPHNDMVLAAIETHGIKKAFLIGRWTFYYKRGTDSRQAPLSDRDTYGRPGPDVFRDSLTKTVKTLRDRGIEVVIMKQAPLQFRSPPAALWMAHRFGYNPDEAGVTIAEHLEHQKDVNAIIDSLAQPGVIILDPLPILTVGEHTRVQQDGRIFYFDENHLSKEGVRALAPLFRPHLRSF